MEATVCLPWRPQPDRIAAYEFVNKYWRDQGFEVVEADSDPDGPFFCSQARNNAVRKADTDIVICADADTVPLSIQSVHQAIQMIEDNWKDFVLPFTQYIYVPSEWIESTAVIDGVLTFPLELTEPSIGCHTIDEPSGGLTVARKTSFWEMGGFDEQFIPGQWGFDDLAFLVAANTLFRSARIQGTIFSFDHSGDRDGSDNNPNKARCEEYMARQGKPDLMREFMCLPR